MMPNCKIDRSQYKEVVRELMEPDSTLQSVANRYGVSRERIRQICEVAMDDGYSPLSNAKIKSRRQKRERESQELAVTIKFHCRVCNKPVTYGEAHGRSVFCSPDCWRHEHTHRREKEPSICQNCKGKYHRLETIKYSKRELRHNFCGIKCYHEYYRKNTYEFPRRTSPRAKTLDRAKYIKEKYRPGEYTLTAISKDLGIPQYSVSRIYRRYVKNGDL